MVNSYNEPLNSIGAIAIVSAMDAELAAFLDQASVTKSHSFGMSKIFESTLFDNHVVLVKSGVGKVLSAAVAQYLIDQFKPRAILFTGLAGSLNPKHNIGDVLIGSDYVQHDMDARALGFARGVIPYTDIRFLEADPKLLSAAKSYSNSLHAVYTGRILTGDIFMTHADAHTHRYMVEELQGDAVDMEGASVALVSAINKVPFLAVRTISDRANGDAHVDFKTFLPVASENSVGIVKHILQNIAQP